MFSGQIERVAPPRLVPTGAIKFAPETGWGLRCTMWSGATKSCESDKVVDIVYAERQSRGRAEGRPGRNITDDISTFVLPDFARFVDSTLGNVRAEGNVPFRLCPP
eukprot:8133522-Pyramimonas_sp.AAC.1